MWRVSEPTHMCVTWSTAFMINSNCVCFLFYFLISVCSLHILHRTLMGFFQVLIHMVPVLLKVYRWFPSFSVIYLGKADTTEQIRFKECGRRGAKLGLNETHVSRLSLSSSRQTEQLFPSDVFSLLIVSTRLFTFKCWAFIRCRNVKSRQFRL